MILIKPRLGEHLVAIFEECAHFHRFLAFDREIELGAPMALYIVRYGFRHDVAELAARGPEHRLGFGAKRQIGEWRAGKLHHEFAHALRARLARLAAIAQTRRDNAAERRRKRLIGKPMQTIREIVGATTTRSTA